MDKLTPAMNNPPFHHVPASHGFLWIRHAWRMYWLNPLMWIAYSVTIVIVGASLSMIPVVGSFAFQLLSPAFNGGLMMAARDQHRQQPLHIKYLLAAFHSHGAQLVTIGGVYMTGMILAFTLPSLFSDDPFIHALMYEPIKTLPTVIMHSHLSLTASLVLLASLTLFTAMLMAYWFAPALVALADYPAIKAMKVSFAACTTNFAAFIVYGVLMFTLLIIGSVPFLLGYLIVIPLGFISYYSAYEDLFTPVTNREPTP